MFLFGEGCVLEGLCSEFVAFLSPLLASIVIDISGGGAIIGVVDVYTIA